MRLLVGAVGLTVVVGALWWLLFGLRPYAVTAAHMQARYALPPGVTVQADVQPWSDGRRHGLALRFRSFDGSEVTGRLLYPADPAQARAPYPLLLGLHAMGRSHARWWEAVHKDKPTLEHTHLITEMALQQGYAVLALDARLHGDRKIAAQGLRKLMVDMHLWGRRDPYERMVVDTVRDYRLLLDWVATQPQLDLGAVRAAGYSMGAQMALLLGGMDARIAAVLAIVPPHLDDKVAMAAPRNALPGLAGKTVWLVSAEADEHASVAQNEALFGALPGPDKRHLRFAGGHLLPAGYVEPLLPWFKRR
ncbi:MAG: alpha/beta hydrolase family protein [Roseateles sp.]|uniref:alpha/beta hydrolase family protein n=1 Tax=Roseateles sp. TaxID=1971397 RepID=UPI004036D265